MVGNLARSRADVASDTIVPAYLCTPAVVLFRYCLVDPHGNSPRRGPVTNFRSAELTTFARWQHVEGVSSPPAASEGERGPFLATGTHTFSSAAGLETRRMFALARVDHLALVNTS